jgi:outer membrane lipoprotein-sorting protein
MPKWRGERIKTDRAVISPQGADNERQVGKAEKDMAGTSQRTVIAVVSAAFLTGTVGVAPAAAQHVPLPPPAPLPKTGAVPPPPSSIPSAKPAAPTPPASSGGSSWLPSLPSIFGGGQPPAAKPGPGATTTTTAFEPSQRTLVDKVSAYLSTVHVMSGNFAQVSADGRRTNGQFYILKPGKVRFEYDPPTPIDIIADGSSVVVRDRKLATQDLYPLSQTPLRYLLTDRIDLLRDTNVIGVHADELYVTIVIEEKQAVIGTSRLMMMFGAKDFQLKQWVVTDPQGYDTTIAVSNLDSVRRPDPNLFKIDYTDYTR